MFAFSAEAATELSRLEGAQLDDLARLCARAPRRPRAGGAELAPEISDEGEPELALFTIWDQGCVRDFKRLPRRIRSGGRDASSRATRPGAWPCRAIPRSPWTSTRSCARTRVLVEEPAAELLGELVAEHERASGTVALSYADDAELDGLVLGGELHPFQRAGVRYALERRRTFIADEQGLGRPCRPWPRWRWTTRSPRPWSAREHEARLAARDPPLASDRGVAVLDGRIDSTWSEEAEQAELVVLNYDILDAHLERLAGRGLRALVLDESHYVRTRAPSARRPRSSSWGAPDEALRLALTGTPVLNGRTS